VHLFQECGDLFETTAAPFSFLYFVIELCANAMSEIEKTPAESPQSSPPVISQSC
jgi:hypothetical protein